MSTTLSVNPEHYAVVKVLAAAFPHNKITKETILAYTTFLADTNPVALRRAASWCMGNSEFFPTMRALRVAIYESDLENRAPTAGDAWAEVLGTFRGSRSPESFSHPLVRRAVDAMGGRSEIGMSTAPDGVQRGQFLKIYEMLETRYSQDERAAPIGGEDVWEALGALTGQLALPVAEIVSNNA